MFYSAFGEYIIENMHNIIKVDIVISINVYHNVDFLKKQLLNIEKHVLSQFCVVLNCNESMYNELKNITLPNYVYINPHVINKKRFHGSLFHGIVSNMNYSVNNFEFKYFLILSARTFFYKTLITNNLNTQLKVWNNIDEMKNNRIKIFNKDKWSYWPTTPAMLETKLIKYYLNLGYTPNKDAHEGMCFSNNVVSNILNFLSQNTEIRDELYNYEACVEEFALQTISYNEINLSNLEYGYINIGNGETNNYDKNAVNLYTKKIDYD